MGIENGYLLLVLHKGNLDNVIVQAKDEEELRQRIKGIPGIVSIIEPGLWSYNPVTLVPVTL